jgi:hypothetical protein
MAEQSLDGDEQLNIRWAYEDPNPRSIKQIQNEKEQRVVDALRAAGHTPAMGKYNAPSNYRVPVTVPTSRDTYQYPDTTVQFDRHTPMTREMYMAQKKN